MTGHVKPPITNGTRTTLIEKIKVAASPSLKDQQWTLISPEGTFWQGDLQAITIVVCQQQLKTNVP